MFAALSITTLVLAAPAVAGIVIDNDLAPNVLGHFSADVVAAGDVVLNTADPNDTALVITAQPFNQPGLSTQDVVFRYHSIVDVGNGGIALNFLATSGPSPAPNSDPDSVVSAGSFRAADGVTMIDWTTTTSIPDGTPGVGSVMTTVYTFTARGAQGPGTIGPLRFYQYLDEDVSFTPDDDVFFSRGSAGTDNLRLFTVDNVDVIGISHGGAMTANSGLVNATFAGYAVNEFNAPTSLLNQIVAGTAVVSPAGDIQNLPALNHPVVGPSFGPADIVSALAWDVDPAASTATIVTTIGGVPNIANDINPPLCESLTQDRGLAQPGGFASDNAPNDSGIQSLALRGEVNLTLSAPNFQPGDPTVQFSVHRTNSAQDAFGDVVVTDMAGNHCTFTVDSGVQLPVLLDDWPENIWFDSSTAMIPMQDFGLDIDDVSAQDQVAPLGHIGAASVCPGFFGQEIQVDPSGFAVLSSGGCGIAGVDVTNPQSPQALGSFAIPGGFVEELALTGSGAGTIGYAAAYDQGLQILAPVCDTNGCVITTLGSLGVGDPTWGPALAVAVAQDLGGFAVVVFVATTEGLQIVDASNPTMPVQIAQVNVNPSGASLASRDNVPQDVVVTSAGYAYLSLWIRGIMELDVTNPASPAILSQPTQSMSAYFKLALSRPQDRLLAAEGTNGLAVFVINRSNVGTGNLRREDPMVRPVGEGDPECGFNNGVTNVCFAWGVYENAGIAGVTYGTYILNPPTPLSGGYQFFDLGGPAPPCGLLGIEPVVVLIPWAWRRRKRARAQ